MSARSTRGPRPTRTKPAAMAAVSSLAAEAAFGAAQDEHRLRRHEVRREPARRATARRQPGSARPGSPTAPRPASRPCSQASICIGARPSAREPVRTARSPPQPPRCQWRRRASARSPARRSTERSQSSGWIAAAPSSVAFSTSASMRSFAGTPSASVTAIGSSRSTRDAGADAQLDLGPADARDLGLPLETVVAVEEQRPSRPAAGAAPAGGATRPPAAPALRQGAKAVRRERCAATSERHPARLIGAGPRRGRARPPPEPAIRAGRRAPPPWFCATSAARARTMAKLSNCGSSRMNRRPTSAVPSTLATMMSRMPSSAWPSPISQSAAILSGTEQRRRRQEQERARGARGAADDATLEAGDRRPAGRRLAAIDSERPPAPFLDEEDDRDQAEGQAVQQPPRAGDGLHDEASRRVGRERAQPP